MGSAGIDSIFQGEHKEILKNRVQVATESYNIPRLP